MSRKHAPAPDTDALTLAEAIARRLHEIRDGGGTPLAIVMGPDVAPILHQEGIGGWAYGRPELFNLPVEVDTQAAGWPIRVK